MKRTQFSSVVGTAVVLFAVGASQVFAHAVVKPAEVGVKKYQTFTLGVPNEKISPTNSIRLLVPEGLKSVTPNVKPGWKVEVKKQATGKKVTDEDGSVTDELKPIEITWTGGSIPAGQRDDFIFSAQAPAEKTTLAWKVYQGSEDGNVVSWDKDPEVVAAENKAMAEQMKNDPGMDMSHIQNGPYSQTKVTEDATASQAPSTTKETPTTVPSKSATFALVLSVVAVVLSLASLGKSKA